jgi:endonuclease-3 related protein
MFQRLFDSFGPQYWWPAQTRFEVIVGAILTQNTAWKNVERSMEVLRKHSMLSPGKIHRTEREALAPLLRSSGYYNQKARKLKAFCAHLEDQWQGDLDLFLDQDMVTLRRELLQIHGVGPETADSIVLYAAHRPSFVVDAYTRRIVSRHGLLPPDSSYEALRRFFMDCLDPDVDVFQEFHALLVRVGHLYCRPRPLCEKCPLSKEARPD